MNFQIGKDIIYLPRRRRRSSTGGGPSGPHDSLISKVVLLMGFEGINGSQTAPGMTDESPSAHGTGTVLGAQISTAHHFAGSSSLYTIADVSGASYVQFPNSANWDFGAGPFTIEGFIFPDTVSGGSVPQYIFKGHNWFLLFAGTNLQFTCTDGTTTVIVQDPVTISGAHQMSYVCADFDGVKYRLYNNAGASPLPNAAMVAFSTTLVNILNASTPVTIGSPGTTLSDSHYFGWLDEFRITKGAARYATDTSFPLPQIPFPRG